MLLSLKVRNGFIYHSEVAFSMQANMHYKRFPNNVAAVGDVNVLKTAVLFGPNNSGKTNFVRILGALKAIMLGQRGELRSNLFFDEPLVELSVTFLEGGAENLFAFKYDVSRQEFVYERFAEIHRDKYKNERSTELFVRDSLEKHYAAEDEGLAAAMPVAARNNILIYMVDTEAFPCLKRIKERMVAFASRLDLVDMNRIPIKKTIEMMKASGKTQRKIANFVRNADLYLDDYAYLTDDKLKIVLETPDGGDEKNQEQLLPSGAPLWEMLHLTSVYKGVSVPSILFDSTGTKKMAALAGYVLDALEHGRILVIDELDSSLHFRLTRAILALFNNELNRHAQLIASVHDVSLMDCRTLFRKEQIWFTHKDREDAYLYSLADFTAEKTGVRESSDLIERYRKGAFGALPEPDLFESLLEETQSG